jgi:hypothetical protein
MSRRTLAHNSRSPASSPWCLGAGHWDRIVHNIQECIITVGIDLASIVCGGRSTLDDRSLPKESRVSSLVLAEPDGQRRSRPDYDSGGPGPPRRQGQGHHSQSPKAGRQRPDWLGCGPSLARRAIRAPTSSDHPSGVGGVPTSTGVQEHRLIPPNGRRRRDPLRAVHLVLAVIDHRRHGGVPAHTERRRHLRDRVGVLPDPPARLGPGALRQHRRDLTWWLVSIQARASQSGSTQRRIRFDHHSTTGRPAIGRSRTVTRRRPCPTAQVPHSGPIAEPGSSPPSQLHAKTRKGLRRAARCGPHQHHDHRHQRVLPHAPTCHLFPTR